MKVLDSALTARHATGEARRASPATGKRGCGPCRGRRRAGEEVEEEESGGAERLVLAVRGGAQWRCRFALLLTHFIMEWNGVY